MYVYTTTGRLGADPRRESCSKCGKASILVNAITYPMVSVGCGDNLLEDAFVYYTRQRLVRGILLVNIG